MVEPWGHYELPISTADIIYLPTLTRSVVLQRRYFRFASILILLSLTTLPVLVGRRDCL